MINLTETLRTNGCSMPSYLSLLLRRKLFEGGPPKDGGVGSGNWIRPEKPNPARSKKDDLDDFDWEQYKANWEKRFPTPEKDKVRLSAELAQKAIEENKKVTAIIDGKLDKSKIPFLEITPDDGIKMRQDKSRVNCLLFQEHFRRYLDQEFPSGRNIKDLIVPDSYKEFSESYDPKRGIPPLQSILGFYQADTGNIYIDPTTSRGESKCNNPSSVIVHESIHAKDNNRREGSDGWTWEEAVRRADFGFVRGEETKERARSMQEGITELLAGKVITSLTDEPPHFHCYELETTLLLTQGLLKHNGDTSKLYEEIKGALLSPSREHLSAFMADYPVVTKSNQAYRGKMWSSQTAFKEKLQALIDKTDNPDLLPVKEAIKTYLKEDSERLAKDRYARPDSENPKYSDTLHKALITHWLRKGN